MADRFDVGDIIKMKKPHPCGSQEWEILRVGADFRLKCMGCGHQIMVPRKLVEKNTRQMTFTKSELESKFSCENLDFNIIAYKKSGRVETLSVGGKNYSGREVREKLGLPSSCFTIDYANGKYTFTTKGSGHGVGMSQYGAQAMALDGASYKDILNHYYTGIEIVNNQYKPCFSGNTTNEVK